MSEALDYASNEELRFSWYLDELVSKGYATNAIYQPKPFWVSKKASLNYKKYGKKKGWYDSEVLLLQESNYRADWSWIWTDKARDVFFAASEDLNPRLFPFYANKRELVAGEMFFQVVDIKSAYNQNDSNRRFSALQKIVYSIHGVYVQEIITTPVVKFDKDNPDNPPTITPLKAIFMATFCPNRYKFTDKKMMKRDIHFPTKTLEEYTNEQRNIVAAIPNRM